MIDAHVHFWEPRSTPRLVSPLVKLLGSRPDWMLRIAPYLFPKSSLDFVGNPRHVIAPHLPGDLRREQQGPGAPNVRGVVHVQAGWHTKDALRFAEETQWLESLCGHELLAIVGAADLAHARLGELLDRHAAASPRFVGVRDMFAFHPAKGVMKWCESEARIEDQQWRRGFALLGQRELSFDAWCYSHQLPQLAGLLAEHPETRVVLDHLGTPIAVGGAYGGLGDTPAEREAILEAWRASLAELARFPQLSVKISGLLMPVLGFGFHLRERSGGLERASVAEAVEAIGPLVEHALATFGVERCIFASNFPMDKVSLSWPTLYAAYDQLTAALSSDERRKLFHDNAAAVYRIAPAAAT